MKSRHSIALQILLIAFLSVSALARETCTVGVVSGSVTIDGRPLLWKNRDSSHKDNEVAFFRGPRYDFIGVINTNDTTQVWMGINTAGFAIMNSESLDQPGDSVDTEGFFMKKALGLCGSVSDFQAMLDSTNQSPRGTRSNFGCIDAFGQAAIFETGNSTYEKFDANDPVQAPDGFVVRANFSMTGKGKQAYGTWRYHRAYELFKKAIDRNQMSHAYILQKVARDLVSDELNPYPLPYKESYDGGPVGFIKTRNSINRYRTVSCAVFRGVQKGEPLYLATMWIILGEPIAGAAIPLWPIVGRVPAELDGEKGSVLNQFFQDLKKRLYPDEDFPWYADSELLVGPRAITSGLIEIEQQILLDTERKLIRWRRGQPNFKEFYDFEEKMISRILRARF